MSRTLKKFLALLIAFAIAVSLIGIVSAEDSGGSTSDNAPIMERSYIQTYADVPVRIYKGNGTPATIRVAPWACPCFYQYWLQDVNDVDIWYGQGNCNNYIDIYAGADVDEVWFQSTGGTVTVTVTH